MNITQMLFGKPKSALGPARSGTGSSTMETLEKLKETYEMLEKRNALLEKKMEAELDKAKAHTRDKNKKAALLCLKKKKMYEEQMDKLTNNQLRVWEQMNMLENAKVTADTVGALKEGAAQMKAIQKTNKIEDLDDTLEEINEVSDRQRELDDALATPVGQAAELDEDELLLELEELQAEALEEEVRGPAVGVASSSHRGAQPGLAEELGIEGAPSVPGGRPAPAKRALTPEEEELAALEAEMAS